MSRSFLKGFGCFLLFFVVFCCGSIGACGAVGAGVARGAVQSAEGRLVVCYGAVVDAESAGGNVTELAAVLNEAGDFLSRAKVAYAGGEFDVAFALASNCTGMLDGFVDRATALRDAAAGEGRVDFLVNIVGSAVGAVAVVVAGWVLWVYLKKRHSGEVVV